MAKNFGRVNVSITASTGGLTRGLGSASKQMRGFATQTATLRGTLTSALAGFVGLGSGATAAAVGVHALGMAIKSLLGPLLIVTSLVQIFAAFGRSSRELDEAGKTARRLGMSMTSFQNLGQVAEEAGVSVGQMSTLLTFMARNLGNLQAGSKGAQKAFAAIGLTFADLQGLSPEQQFELISQRIMALPTAAQRTAAAMAIFGRQGAAGMGLIADASSGALSEIAKLREQLGLNLTDAQVKGIEMMNDALGRVSMVFQGFINQFLAELAPAVTTVSNLIVSFFAQNTQGWSMATTLAQGFVAVLRHVTAAVTLIYGVFQVLSSAVAAFGALAYGAFELVMSGITSMLGAMADAAEQLPGVDVGLASSLRAAQQSAGVWADAAGQEAEIWTNAAADLFERGTENVTNPYGAFDAEMARVNATMQQAGASAGEAFGDTATAAIKASSNALKAIVVGSSEGEAFRNSLLRGADPRLEGDAQKETADNTAEMVDQLDELNASVAFGGGVGVATIGV